MDDGVQALEQVLMFLEASNISLKQGERARIREGAQSFEAETAAVEDADPPSPLEQAGNEFTSEVARTSGDEDIHAKNAP